VKPVRVITQEDVREVVDDEAPAPGPTSTPFTTDEAPSASARAAKGTEEQWRQRSRAVRSRLSRARKRLDEARTTVRTHNGRVVIEPNRIVSAQQELDAATAAVETLEDDARRAGVPASWARCECP
jgi:hypothetical protein